MLGLDETFSNKIPGWAELVRAEHCLLAHKETIIFLKHNLSHQTLFIGLIYHINLTKQRAEENRKKEEARI
jgi:hypothetical protein